MTPTEQDKELRESILVEFRQVHKLAPADYTENCTNIVMQLIAADRERVELEARRNEALCKQHPEGVQKDTLR